MPEARTSAWHAMPAADVVRELSSDAQHGLSAEEAARRLARDGPNVISTRRPRPWWSRLLRQFHAPLIYILLVASAVTLALGEHLDSAVIFAVVFVNALIGFAQETRAVKAIDSLARSMKMEAVVRRDGRRLRIDAAGLVVGDVVLPEAGDRVPADLRLLASHELHADESALTGESKPVSKRPEPLDAGTQLADRRNMLYAGSLVTRGTGAGVVVAVADSTEVGRISQMIAAADDLDTPLTRKIASFSKVLLWIILAVAAASFLVGVVRGHDPVEMFMASVALAVSAIPEGLPAAVTVMLGIGVGRMAARNAVIRRLPAVEALGSTTVICSDKTGTLTQNQMTVRAAWVGGAAYEFTGAGYDPSGKVRAAGDERPVEPGAHPALVDLLRCGALCNDAALHRSDGSVATWRIDGDPTEGALLVAARKLGDAQLDADAAAAHARRLAAVPFESERQYMATLQSLDGRAPLVCVKGSVERVLGMCDLAALPDGRTGPLDAGAVHDAATRLASQGLRVLAFAQRDAAPGESALDAHAIESSRALVFIGLVGMLDPPREEAVRAVAACRAAGVRVKMITGDHGATAASIATMMGIAADNEAPGRTPRVLTGAQMAAVPDDRLPDEAESTAVFARMTPEQKLRLVKALQSRGHIVAMTGDGVNDAPALKQADIGVAMGLSGTEAAKDAADMVLADDNFASIRAAVEEGRAVFDNLVKFIVWTLPTNGGQALVIVSGVALGTALPILPTHALYVNMATAVLLGIPLVFESKAPDLMSRPPRDPRKPIFTFELFMRSGLVSILLCVASAGLFHWELARGESEPSARTAAVTAIVVAQAFYLFSSRALLRPAWAVPLFSNGWLWAGIGAMAALQAAFVHAPFMNTLFRSAPLDAQAWARIAAAGAAVLVIVEAEKAVRRLLRSGGEA
jgi:magnesium-transporting ATPase (P-type)